MNVEQWLAGLVWAVVSGAGGGLVTVFASGSCVFSTRAIVVVSLVTGITGGVSYLKDSRPPHIGVDPKRFTAGPSSAHS